MPDNPPVRYFHGEPWHLSVGDYILPANQTNAYSTAQFGADKVCDPSKVYVTTDKNAAAIFAAMHPSGKGRVYEVIPVGELLPDLDCVTPDFSFCCDKGLIVKSFDFPKHKLRSIRLALLGDYFS